MSSGCCFIVQMVQARVHCKRADEEVVDKSDLGRWFSKLIKFMALE